MDGDTLFELGSASKTFNVTLAALAAERGLLSIDDAVSKHLTGLKGTAFDRISLIDLATHTTGGLPLQVPDSVDGIDSLMRYLAAWQPKAPPETTRSYSNVSIGLLGLISAASFGKSYDRAMSEILFPALGLENTYVHVPPEAEKHYAFGTSRRSDEPIRVNPGVLNSEAYGIKSSANDMLHFLDVHLGDVTLAPDIQAAATQTHTGYFDTAFYTQDMIWEQYPWPTTLERLVAGNSDTMALESQPVTRRSPPLAPQREVYLNKTGSTNGFSAYLALVPSRKLGIVMLANRNFPNADRVSATFGLIQSLLSAEN